MNLKPQYENIPSELCTRKQWVCSELPSKRPVQPNGRAASSTDSSTWSTFEECVGSAGKNGWGVGFVFTADDPYAVIDLDHVRNAESGETEEWALGIIEGCFSYSEISISGTGWHIIVRGRLPGPGNKLGHLEMYDHAKVITLTGNLIPFCGAEEILDVDLQSLHGRMLMGALEPGAISRVTQTKGRGDASAVDFVLALRLARKCSGDPLKTKEEFLRQAVQRPKLGRADYVDQTVRKAIAAMESGTEEKEPSLIGRQEVVVVDMPDSVLDGRLGEICQRRLAAFPIAYSWGALVTCAGTLVPCSEKADPGLGELGIAAQITRKRAGLRTNLYWCPVGGQGSGKTQAIEQALNCLGMWPKHDCLVKGKFGSAEGMLAHLEGVEDGEHKLLFPDELGHLLEKANIEGSSFPFVLNSAYYDDEVFVTMAKGKKAEFKCRLSLAGGVVEEMFGDLFGSKTTGGLHGRFIFGLGPKPFSFLWRPYDTHSENVNPVFVEAESEIWEMRDEWVKNNPGLTPRIAEHALRVATICASFDGRKVLRAKDLGPALEFAKYQVRVRMVLEPNPGENPDARCAFAILGWLRSNAPKGQQVPRRTLYSAIHAARLGPGVFDRALKHLAFNEDAVLGKVGKQAVVSLRAAEDLAAKGSTSTVSGAL